MCLTVSSAQIPEADREHVPLPTAKVTLEVAWSPHPEFLVQDPARKLVLDRCLVSEQLQPLVPLYLKLPPSRQSPGPSALDGPKLGAAAMPTSRGHRSQRGQINGRRIPGHHSHDVAVNGGSGACGLRDPVEWPSTTPQKWQDPVQGRPWAPTGPQQEPNW